MFTTAVKGSAALRWVGGTPGSLNEVSCVRTGLRRFQNVQPIQFPVMRELEDELINHAVDPDRSTDKFEVSVS
jgi:hypothetical protein